MPLISVIVPVYKVESYLRRCVDSILTQTFTDFELILVDDGSPDNCGAICDEYAAQDSRIHVIHQENGGAAKARNIGLDLAQGQYIMFVDADDYLEADTCQKMMDAMCAHDAQCVIAGLRLVYDHGELGETQAVDQVQVLSGREAIRARNLHGRNEINIVVPWGKIFRRSMWEKIRFTDGLYYEDLDIMPYLYHDCETMVLIPDIGYYYYQRSGSASHGTGTDDKRYTDSVFIRKKHIQFYREIGETEIAEEVTKMLLDLIMTSACKGWIPKPEIRHSMQDFRKHARTIVMSSRVSAKGKLRYMLFALLGADLYKQIAGSK